MKKNIFPFIPDANLIPDLDHLLQFAKQPILLNTFFKKIPKNILKIKLDTLEFESENREDTKYFVIKFKDKNNLDKIELTNKDLSLLGMAVTDRTQLINPLINYKSSFLELNLKDALTKLITTTNDKNKQLAINAVLDTLKNTALKHPENENKQIEINLFFKFLKRQILAEKNSKSFSSFTANSLLISASENLISWCHSTENIFIFGSNAAFSKKHTELDDLISELAFYTETSYLAKDLALLNNLCLQTLLNLPVSDDPSIVATNIIEVIEIFQNKTNETIKKFNNDNLLSLEQLNILHKMLNVIARLMPSFIVQKNNRIRFFQQYTPQNKILVKLEKIIQPLLKPNC